MRMSCSECGNEMNKGRCDKCCEHCREVNVLEKGEVLETVSRHIDSAIKEIERRETVKAIDTLRSAQRTFLT